jgi:type 1 glutamine amidotransferase
MSRRALIVWGGWKGHEPEEVAQIFASLLAQNDFQVEISAKLKVLTDAKLAQIDLLIPVWTMGTIKSGQMEAVLRAVERGVGLAGCHGGMCDAFRESTEWQFLTGGQFVAHPGGDGTRYTVKMGPTPSEITEGMSDFEVSSEQYYMHVDPAVKVLATTRFPTVDGPHAPNGPVDMPVIWTKLFGKGKVFYCSLGHSAKIVAMPQVSEIMRRGFVWAAKKPH